MSSASRSTLYTGPMASGKSTILYQIAREYKEKGNDCVLILPGDVLGTTYKPKTSRCGESYDSDYILYLTSLTPELFPRAEPDEKNLKASVMKMISGRDVVFVDEMQFFHPAVIEFLIKSCEESGVNIFCSGLNENYMQEEFYTFTRVNGFFDRVEFLKADCNLCGEKSKAVHSHLACEVLEPISIEQSKLSGDVIVDTKDLVSKNFTTTEAIPEFPSKYISLCSSCSQELVRQRKK